MQLVLVFYERLRNRRALASAQPDFAAGLVA
jgi:hypothetical protein